MLAYSAGPGLKNRVQIVLSGFSMNCFVLSRQKLYVGMVIYIYWLHLCGCDGDVICIGHDLNRCTGLWEI